LSDISTTIKQYPPPGKRKKTIIPSSSSLTSISEKMDKKNKSITVANSYNHRGNQYPNIISRGGLIV
jgi:hypothetical protein